MTGEISPIFVANVAFSKAGYFLFLRYSKMVGGVLQIRDTPEGDTKKTHSSSPHTQIA
jgi:hypothetical protein